MGLRILSSSIPILHVLVFFLMCNGIESRKMSENRNIIYTKKNFKLSSNINGDHDHLHPHDPSEMIFFREEDLKLGNKLPVYFSENDPAKSPRLLPRDEAGSIPFSSKYLPRILSFFSFGKASSQANAMEYTLATCEAEPIEGETKFCATSLESMLDVVKGAFGPESKLRVVSTTMLPGSVAGSVQNYTVLGVPRVVPAPRMVACHTLPYPYAVYYCHYQESENRVYEVSLGGCDGSSVAVEAVAVCHSDTSHWNLDHAAFRVLGVKPGACPVCHFFPADNLIWLPKPSSV